MHQLDTWQAAQDLEHFLADPEVADNPLSHFMSMQRDEADAFPQENIDALRRWGFFNYLVPAEHEGSMRCCEQILAITRIMARRDLTTSIAIGQTLLGALPVWLAGNPGQTASLSAYIRKGSLGCLALTEENHGSDLMSCEVHAEKTSDGYRLSGSKWLINNATRGTTLSVLASTRTDDGKDELSLFYVQKPQLDPDRFENIDKIRTHGIRGADISGITFHAARLPADAVLDRPGNGFILTLKTLQISRILCAGFSLGAADTALRCAMEFACRRRLYHATVVDIPSARAELIGAYLDILISEAVAVTSTRAIDCLPERLTLWSAITKYLVPVTVEELVRSSAVVYGARHFLRQGERDGIFQKLMRDNAVVSLFDGSTAVNLSIIASQLNTLTAGRKKQSAAPDIKLPVRLQQLFTLSQPANSEKFVRAEQLELSCNGKDEVVSGLLWVQDSLPDHCKLQRLIKTLAARLADELEAIDTRIRALNDKGDFKPTSEARFTLSRQYSLVYAASACILLWHFNRDNAMASFESGAWLALCLWRILGKLDSRQADGWLDHPDLAASVWQDLRAATDQGRLYSLFPLDLAAQHSRSVFNADSDSTA